jgi:hypothetical protein
MAAWSQRLLHAIQDSSATFTSGKGQSSLHLECTILILFCHQLAQLEKEVKERSKKDAQKEQTEAEAPIINPGGFGGLLLTNG